MFIGIPVREHHAPVGALRPYVGGRETTRPSVREHHAPAGTLRRRYSAVTAAANSPSGSTTHLQVLLSLYCRRDSGAGWGLRYLRAGRHRVARGGLRGINRDRQWTGVSAAGSPVWCCGRGRGCQGGCRRDRVCGAGPVGAVLHIRPGPAVEGSAESCGNALTINSGEILPCAERAPLHMGERQQEDDDLREPRNRAENPESDRVVFSLPCAIISATGLGKIRPV